MIEFGSRHDGKIPMWIEGGSAGEIFLARTTGLWIAADLMDGLRPDEYRAIADKLESMNSGSASLNEEKS